MTYNPIKLPDTWRDRLADYAWATCAGLLLAALAI